MVSLNKKADMIMYLNLNSLKKFSKINHQFQQKKLHKFEKKFIRYIEFCVHLDFH